MNKGFPFNIGADPEFSIVFENQEVAADKLTLNYEMVKTLIIV